MEQENTNIKPLEERIADAQRHCRWMAFRHNLPDEVKQKKRIVGFHPPTPTQKMGLCITKYAEERLKATLAW